MSRQYPPHVQRGILPETPLMNRINIHNTISVSAFRALEISHLAIKGLLACFKAASCGAARCSQPSESPSRAVYGMFCACFCWNKQAECHTRQLYIHSFVQAWVNTVMHTHEEECSYAPKSLLVCVHNCMGTCRSTYWAELEVSVT